MGPGKALYVQRPSGLVCIYVRTAQDYVVEI